MAEGCLAVVVTVTNVHLPRITLPLCCCQRRDIQPLFDLRPNSQHHFLLFDIHIRQFKSTAQDVSLEASKYTCRSSDSPHHHIANQEYLPKLLLPTPLPLNPQLGWFKMCTEKEYFHNCGHPTRNRTSRKETCTEAKYGLKCTPRKVEEYVHNSACPTCREIKNQQLPNGAVEGHTGCGCIVC